MARTRHKTVTKVASKNAKGRKAKNSNLKQAAHGGAPAVADARTAQSGYAAVPVSIATMPPGEGPPMSSATPSAGRGGSRLKKTSTSAGVAPTASNSASSVQPIQNATLAIAHGRGRKRAKRRARGKR